MTLTTPPLLVDNSTYSKILAIYTRNKQKNLLSFENKNGFSIEKCWDQISRFQKTEIGNGCDVAEQLSALSISNDQLEDANLDLVPEHFEDNDGLLILEESLPQELLQTRGLIMVNYRRDDQETQTQLNLFHDWFTDLVIKTSRLHFSVEPRIFDNDKSLAAAITDLFDERLRYLKHGADLWKDKGRSYFIERVHFFTSRGLKIEAVLPAFPCKSSNFDKVNGLYPDKGEELALRRMIEFTKDVEIIYPQGLKFFIVSDGHVFSDCIGVDDDIVDSYTRKLKEFYGNIAKSCGVSNDTIGFVSLKDVFFSKNPKELARTGSYVTEISLPHYIDTKICPDAELSRKFLMAGCDTDAGKLRRDIEEPDHPRLSLFRGFSKFMSEDVKLHPFGKELSNKAIKKTGSKVAFEMIKRNDAYSNLVELIFPFHLRLSIHAHRNDGPKFGIRIISHDNCRTIESLDSDTEPQFEDLLHIPTPWHNCIVQIEGHDHYYMTKSKIVKDAMENGHYSVNWIETDTNSAAGGYYSLVKVKN